MTKNIIEFVEIFYKKIWFWLVVSIVCAGALLSSEFFEWLGFYDNRWMVGVTFIVSLSLLVQNICDWIKKYRYERTVIESADYLPNEAERDLKNLIDSRKQTFRVNEGRIAAHFKLERDGDYATFPYYLWKALQKKFEKKQD